MKSITIPNNTIWRTCRILFEIFSCNNSDRLEYDMVQAGRGHKNTSGLRIPTGEFRVEYIFSNKYSQIRLKILEIIMTSET